MNKKVDFKDFELKKVKFNSKKGLVVDFFDLSSPNDLWNVDSDSQPSEDYIKSLNTLKEVFAYSLGYNNGWDSAREYSRKNDDNLKKAKMFWDQEIEKCLVSGLVLVGSENNPGIKITGSLSTELGSVGLSSPTIRFDDEITNTVDETIMIGDLAETAYNQVRMEVWKFIFQGKRGGLDLFPSEDEKGGLNISKMQKVG